MEYLFLEHALRIMPMELDPTRGRYGNHTWHMPCPIETSSLERIYRLYGLC